MMYFNITREYNATDLIDDLIGEGNNTTDSILELAQEFNLESELLNIVDLNIGENVELWEVAQDIDENPNDYIKCLIDNIDEDNKKDLLESIKYLGE